MTGEKTLIATISRVSMSQSPPSTASAFRPTPEGMHVVYSSAFRPAEACPTLAGQGSFPVAAATSPPAGITSSFPGDQLQASQMHIQYVLVDPSVFRTMTPNPAAIHGAPGHPTPIRQVSPASPAPLILQPMLGLPSMMMSAPPPMIISPPSAAMEPAHVYPYRTMVTTPTTTTEAGRRSSILPDAVKEVEQGAETSSQSSPSPTMDGRGEPPALISKRPAQHRPAHSSDSGAGLGTVHASGGGGAYEPPSLTSPQRSAELSCASPPPSWMNRQRIRFTVMQTSYLEDHYKKEPYPPLTARKKIAEEFNMKEKCIRVWFQNKRAREKLQKNAKTEAAAGSSATSATALTQEHPALIPGHPIDDASTHPAGSLAQAGALRGYASPEMLGETAGPISPDVLYASDSSGDG